MESPSSAALSLDSSPLSSLAGTPSPPGSPMSSSSDIFSQVDPSRRYPSPTSSASTSGTQTPSKKPRSKPTTTLSNNKTGGAVGASGAKGKPKASRPRPSDGKEKPARPAKRAKLSGAALWPKERTTEYLDLMKPQDEWTEDDGLRLERLCSSLRKKKKIVVIAGAGMSVSAGIPDFRSSTGLFAPAGNQAPGQRMRASGKHLFDASVYKDDQSTESFHTMVREMASMASRAQPTPFHHMLASLAREGRLLRLYSQNIDCLDTELEPLATRVPLNSRGPWPTTIQLHGGLSKMVCTKCAQLSPFDGTLFDGPEAPLCSACKAQDEVRTAFAGKRSHGIGRLRPRFVLYNEFNPDGEAIGNVSSADLKTRPDAVLVVGTSLKVPGTRRLVKEMCQVTRGRRDGFTAFINTDSEPKGAEFRDCWDLVVRAPCDMVARELACADFSCSIGSDYLLSPEDSLQTEMRCRATKLEVGVPAAKPDTATTTTTPTTNRVKNVDGMPTPRPSPKMAASKGPRGTTKQTKLSFNLGKDAKKDESTTGKAQQPKATASRARGRKPLRTSQPKNTVAQAFRATKATVTEVDVKAAAAADKVHRVKVEDEHKDRPVTPTDETARPDTISPRSVPKSMADLIDV